MTGATARVAVAFPAGRGVRRWHERNAESPVPSAWPYGLDGLATPTTQLAAVELEPVGRGERWSRRLGVHRPRRPAAAIADVALAWDETLAESLAVRAPGARLFCGVIWATDEAAGDPGTSARADALRSMAGLWVLSRPQVELVRGWLGPDCPPVHFLPFGVDADFYAATAYPQQPAHLVSIGGDRDRDTATLYAAIEAVLQVHPDLRVTVQTTSPLAPPAGVVTHRFIPHDAVRGLYADAALVAIATRPNVHGSGMTVALETMSSARPVIACDTPGMSDYVVDGVTGHLVPTEDPAVLARRILELLADRDGAAAMGARGRGHVIDGFTTRTMCRELARIIGSGAPD